MKKKYKVILISILALIVIGILSVIYIFNKPHKNTFDLDAEYSLNAIELFYEFNNDEQTANSKYLGKIVEVKGALVNVNENADGIELSLEDEIFGVTCLIDSSYAATQNIEISNLKLNDKITIKGQCNGFLTDVKIDRCILVIEDEY